ncbi:MAG: M28 family peptidase [Calditrichaeota bacterium]|nr:M28 family peptidase [Calditrichota bacterium]
MKFLVSLCLLLFVSCASHVKQASPERMKTNLSYLASDDLKGRGTATKEQKMAADYIVNQFKSAGLKPYKTNFEISFTYNGEVKLGDANSLTIGSNNLTIFKDFSVMSFAKSGEGENVDAVFAGFGIESDDYSSYSKLNVTDKVVFAFDGFPEGTDNHSQTAMKSSVREKARVAREQGAKAIVILVQSVADQFLNRHVNTDAGITVLELTESVFADQFGINDTQMKRLKAAKYPKISLSKRVSFHAEIERLQQEPVNIVAMKSGKKSDEYIIFGAHYDHLGLGYQSGGYKENAGQIHNGADDNASGTTGLIELAYMLDSYSPNYTVLFMAFSGEELGLLGSKALIEQDIVDPTKVKVMINMDMIGRLDPSEKALTIFGSGTGAEFDTLLAQIKPMYDLVLKPVEHSPGNSDHASFYREKIPVLFFNTALHSDYHKPTDDADLINYNGEATVVNFISDVYQKLDMPAQTVTYVEIAEPAQQRMSPFRVYIGTHPDYAYQGKGLKITGMSPASPAEKAGMQKNDILVEMDGKKIENIYDYMGVLGSLEPDKEIPIKVKRDEKVVELKMTPAPKN